MAFQIDSTIIMSAYEPIVCVVHKNYLPTLFTVMVNNIIGSIEAYGYPATYPSLKSTYF